MTDIVFLIIAFLILGIMPFFSKIIFFEHIFDSEDCIVEIMLDYKKDETPELYDFNDYKKITAKIINHKAIVGKSKSLKLQKQIVTQNKTHIFFLRNKHAFCQQ